jgi:hypothetical protein
MVDVYRPFRSDSWQYAELHQRMFVPMVGGFDPFFFGGGKNMRGVRKPDGEMERPRDRS